MTKRTQRPTVRWHSRACTMMYGSVSACGGPLTTCTSPTRSRPRTPGRPPTSAPSPAGGKRPGSPRRLRRHHQQARPAAGPRRRKGRGDRGAAGLPGRPAHPQPAAVIRLIFEFYTKDRLGARAIACILNERGHRTTTGGRWSAHQVLRVLANRIYLGEPMAGPGRTATTPATGAPDTTPPPAAGSGSTPTPSSGPSPARWPGSTATSTT